MWSKVKKSWLVAVAMLALGVGLGFGAASPARTVQGQTAVDQETDLLHNIYNKANPSVVSIDVRVPGSAANQQNPNNGSPFSPFGGPQQQNGNQPFEFAAGSGFMYDNQGHIITNAHVVQGADRVEITFSDDTMMMAKIIGIDPDSDIAVIQAQGNTSKYTPLVLANSDNVVVGDRAIAIGNPFQESGTMTKGIVSGIHRSVEGLASAGNGQSYQIPDTIQTDAALNPGNSGGPLLNDNAEVIGVNEQIASSVRQSSGVSFSIPSNLVKLVADQIIAGGKVQHAWLGIAGNSLTLDINQSLKMDDNMHGVYVDSVQPGSPAAQAGLKGASGNISNQADAVAPGGDVITAVDGQKVTHFDDLTAYLFEKAKVGQTITLSILRDGKQMDVKVTLAARPTSSQS